MLNLSQVVRPGPGQFICESGALSLLDEKLSVFKQPVLIAGDKSYEAFKKHYPGKRDFKVLKYNRTSSHEDMECLASQVPEGTDVLVGIGGGTALDTTKGTASMLGVELITIPTVLGTCAGFTPLSVVYHPDHTFKKVEYYERGIHLCLMDLDLLVESPKEYFMGGIGDTLAKWYEAAGITEHFEGDLPAMVEVGLSTAKVTQEILLRDTKEGLANLEAKTVTPAFKRLAETIVGVAGTVGGFAGEYGRMAGAHAIHNGMSLVPETHAFEHGVKVAYGVLVQLVAAGKEVDVETLLPFYKENNFPSKLSDFGVKDNLEEKVNVVAEFAASDAETFNLAVKNVTTEQVRDAMLALEAK
ncbi:iron-containing alcohol dehydrogenase family protein [Aerococcaceae bacterium DSM 111022]|nr:iron-containing alcohol dehydrogenase family protein [Aerococcaceae bacterium DSM 111022]